MTMNIPVVDQCNDCEKVGYIGAGGMSARFSPVTKWRPGTCTIGNAHQTPNKS